MKIFLFIFLTPFFISPQDSYVHLDTSLLRIGEQFNLTVRLYEDNVDSIIFPNLDSLFLDFELLNETQLEYNISPDSFSFKTYTLTSFDTGLFVLPKLPIIQSDYDTLFLQSGVVRFVAQPVDTTNNFFDIKPPKDIKFSIKEIFKYYPYILIILMLIFLFYLYRRFFKKTTQVETNNSIQVPIDIEFLNRVKLLKKKKYISKKEYQLFYIELSEIFRGFVEARFNVLALESSTYELKLILSELKIKDDWISSFLRVSDIVKFAKGTPNDDESLSFLDHQSTFIKKYTTQKNSENKLNNKSNKLS